MMIDRGAPSFVTWPNGILRKISISLVKHSYVNKKRHFSACSIFSLYMHLLYFDFEQAQDNDKKSSLSNGRAKEQ